MDDSTKDTPRFVFLFSIAHYFIIITRTGARAPSFCFWDGALPRCLLRFFYSKRLPSSCVFLL